MLLGKAAGRLRLPFDADSLTGMVAKCAAAILLATVAWYLFEKSLLRLKRWFSSKRHPTAEGTGKHSELTAGQRPIIDAQGKCGEPPTFEPGEHVIR